MKSDTMMHGKQIMELHIEEGYGFPCNKRVFILANDLGFPRFFPTEAVYFRFSSRRVSSWLRMYNSYAQEGSGSTSGVAMVLLLRVRGRDQEKGLRVSPVRLLQV